MTKKTLLPTNDLYLQFTDEEIQELGWEAGQKLEVKQHDDGSIELRPYVKIELDMEEWQKVNNILFQLLGEYCGKDPEQVKKDASRDLWLTAQEALEYGIIDEVITKKK